MEQASQFFLTHKELTQMMIKQLGITEGKWAIIVQFEYISGYSGPRQNDILPSTFVGVRSIGLQRADTNTPDHLVVDASNMI